MNTNEPMLLIWRMGVEDWRCIAHDTEHCPECVKVTLPPTDHPTPGVETRGRPSPFSTDSATAARAIASTRRYATPSSSGRNMVYGNGAPLCPRCGGTQFKVRRRTSTKVLFGVASLLGQAKHVRCVTCGAEYDRG
jgi:hypothetical protein